MDRAINKNSFIPGQAWIGGLAKGKKESNVLGKFKTEVSTYRRGEQRMSISSL